MTQFSRSRRHELLDLGVEAPEAVGAALRSAGSPTSRRDTGRRASCSRATSRAVDLGEDAAAAIGRSVEARRSAGATAPRSDRCHLRRSMSIASMPPPILTKRAGLDARRDAERRRAVEKRRAGRLAAIVAEPVERHLRRVEPVAAQLDRDAAVRERRQLRAWLDRLVVLQRPGGVRVERARVAEARAIARAEREPAASRTRCR